jgi:transposase-like protein
MSVMEEKPARTRRSFTEEFKRDAVAMVLDDDNTIVEVAGRLGVGEGTLGNWVRQERIDRGERAARRPLGRSGTVVARPARRRRNDGGPGADPGPLNCDNAVVPLRGYTEHPCGTLGRVALLPSTGPAAKSYSRCVVRCPRLRQASTQAWCLAEARTTCGVDLAAVGLQIRWLCAPARDHAPDRERGSLAMSVHRRAGSLMTSRRGAHCCPPTAPGSNRSRQQRVKGPVASLGRPDSLTHAQVRP